MGDVEELCERVIIIDKGKILFDGKLEDIVKKYAKHKLLSVVFNKTVEKKELEKLGKVKEFDFPRAVIQVSRESSNHVASALLDKFPIDDLNIEEAAIEDIIRDVFSHE